jgi:hypothetical protein
MLIDFTDSSLNLGTTMNQLPPRPAPRLVLLSNDDGPPGPDSPFLVPFLKKLREKLGWRVM